MNRSPLNPPFLYMVALLYCLLHWVLHADSANAQASFQGMGIPSNAMFSVASDVSADGSKVVGWVRYGMTPLSFEAYHWTNGGMTLLGDLGVVFTDSEASGISGDGSVIVGRGTTGTNTANRQRYAVRWDEGVPSALDSLPDTDVMRAYNVNEDGSVIVGYGDYVGSEREAFRWQDGAMVGLGDLPGGAFDSQAFDVNADGSVVVGNGNSFDGVEAFRWENGSMVGLGFQAGGDSSFARGVSADGSVVVGGGRSTQGPQAFRWTSDGGMQGLGDLPGSTFNSHANAVSADGSVIVGRSSTTSISGVSAFVWDVANGMRDLQQVLVDDFNLNLTGWALSEATGVSADGFVVVGNGVNPDGRSEGWIATLGCPVFGATSAASDSGAVCSGSITWTNASGGKFQDTSNWDLQRLPTDTDQAVFDLLGTYTVTFDSDAATDSLTVRAGNLNLQTGDSRYDVKRLEVGSGAGSATLFVNSSNVITLNEHGLLAEEILVDAGGTLRNSAQLFVGDVDFPPSGAGANQSLTDLQATKALRVRSGGIVLAAQTRIDGADDGTGVGVAESTGVGSTLSTAVLRLGGKAAATLDVTGGAVLRGLEGASADLTGSIDSPHSQSESVLTVSGSGSSGGQVSPSTIVASRLDLGVVGRGALVVDGGAEARVDAVHLGNMPGTRGRMTIDDNGTRFSASKTVSANIIVGDGGRGELFITGGARVEAAVSIGEFLQAGPQDGGVAQVRGTGTELIAPTIKVGVSGSGELTIDQGAVVDSTLVSAGAGALGHGVISVSGLGTRLTSEFRIDIGVGESGNAGEGELIVSDGAVVNVGPVQGFITIGTDGTLEVTSGGQVSASRIEQTGTTSVSGAGSMVTSSVGYRMAGLLSVSDQSFLEVEGEALYLDVGSQLTIDNAHVNARTVDAYSEIDLSDGGQLVVQYEIKTHPSTVLDAGDGAVTIGAIAPLDGQVRIGDGGLLIGNGVIRANSILTAGNGVNNFGGKLLPGTSPGTLTIEGDYTQGADGSLEIEIGGATPGEEHDVLAATGDVTIDGLIIFKMINGFAPKTGDAFEFLAVDGLIDFTGVDFQIENLAPDFEFEVTATAAGFSMVALNDGTFVPEPTALVLVTLILATAVLHRSRLLLGGL